MGVVLTKIMDAIGLPAYAITVYCFLKSLVIFMSFGVDKVLSVNDYTSVIVAVVVLFYWITRYLREKKDSKRKNHLMDLEQKLKEMKINNLEMEKEHEELLKNDK